jgi:hypothetical protein
MITSAAAAAPVGSNDRLVSIDYCLLEYLELLIDPHQAPAAFARAAAALELVPTESVEVSHAL